MVVDTVQYVLVYTLPYSDFCGKESPLSMSQGFDHSPNEVHQIAFLVTSR